MTWSMRGAPDAAVVSVPDRNRHERLVPLVAPVVLPDVLVNNEGAASMNAFALMPLSSVRRITDTNFMGAAIVTHGAIRLSADRPQVGS